MYVFKLIVFNKYEQYEKYEKKLFNINFIINEGLVEFVINNIIIFL